MITFLHFLTNCLVVSVAIGIHYETLSRLYRELPKLPLSPRTRIITGVVGAIVAHSLEVLVFALGYYLTDWSDHGALAGAFSGSAEDYIYFSYSVFTTVGFGDIYPMGQTRWLAGIESLTGLVLITWTASFLYLEMARTWKTR